VMTFQPIIGNADSPGDLIDIDDQGRRRLGHPAPPVPSVSCRVPDIWEGADAGGERPGQAGCVGARATAWGQGNGLRAVVTL
jgi:hypothetical protein